MLIPVLISLLRNLKLLKIIEKQFSMFLSFDCLADISIIFLEESTKQASISIDDIDCEVVQSNVVCSKCSYVASNLGVIKRLSDLSLKLSN